MTRPTRLASQYNTPSWPAPTLSTFESSPITPRRRPPKIELRELVRLAVHEPLVVGQTEAAEDLDPFLVVPLRGVRQLTELGVARDAARPLCELGRLDQRPHARSRGSRPPRGPRHSAGGRSRPPRGPAAGRTRLGRKSASETSARAVRRLVLEIRHGERGEQPGHERLARSPRASPATSAQSSRSTSAAAGLYEGHEVQRLRDKYTAAPLSENSIIRPVAISETRSAELIGTPSRLK